MGAKGGKDGESERWKNDKRGKEGGKKGRTQEHEKSAELLWPTRLSSSLQI